MELRPTSAKSRDARTTGKTIKQEKSTRRVGMQERVRFPTKLGTEETTREKAIVLVEYMNITGSESERMEANPSRLQGIKANKN